MLNIMDQTAVNAVKLIQNPLLDKIMVFFTSLGDNGIIWIILMIVLLSGKKTRNKGVVLLITVITVFILTNYLKEEFHRVRPYEYMNFIPKVKTSGTSSFPSAHSAVAFAVFGVYYFYNLRYKYVIGVIALIIAVSRFYLEVHYLSDVLAGIALGLTVSYILFHVNEIILKSVKINNVYNILKRFFTGESQQ
ncbi:Undecaprenyl-diphosphatase BcrC [Sebaldella termitidis]|uniref:Phosphoesterase PA-phosphatase related protein n=1 Tax=Sebaldella termitidis (strain ATCC 33386 / NCTC 11300) TaxID=526218 RepID=D1AME3_SEBTE|nr:phosphatase PAP2 family protein [Sebaldella termitidis]ACZ09517.1 phosphoesterase PA-phosphatase related protein [Sebaldella termitidis ATCC 33386]SUI24847.1 Undecaprenyl-diphosphatase BcrC [Sebaldella termitidis]